MPTKRIHPATHVRRLSQRHQVPQKGHGPWHDRLLISTPEDPPRRPPQSHVPNALHPMDNSTHTGILEATMAYPAAQNRRTQYIEDLRPICLLEIFRKLWTSILTYRIRTTWKAQDMLEPSKHGFRANHGTDSASLLLFDAVEQAK